MPRRPPPDPDIPAVTAMESPEDIRKAIEARKAAQKKPVVERPTDPAPPPTLAAQPPAPPPPAAVATTPEANAHSMPRPAATYRPTFRPPIGLLTVFDDGKTDGEVVRLRADCFVIGRSEGDLLLPHDGLVSARHLEISRQMIDNVWRWVVSDLETTNGLFVRVSRTDLSDGAEFLVGRGRYRFEGPAAPQPGPGQGPPADVNPGMTRPWGEDAPRARPPVLLELQSGQTAARFPLVAAEYWIGSDTTCTICRADDPFAEPRHVRLSRTNTGEWEARNNKSPNGLWLRVAQIVVEGVCLFQIGEQRFRLSAGT